MTRALAIAAFAAVVGLLAYLRDPPWLLRVESGFRWWERAEDGTPYRWTGGHASFFVPAGARTVVIPLRTIAEPRWPIVVTITIDDRPADRVELADGNWHVSELRMPAPSSRRVRRIDIRANRSRAGDRAVQVGVVRSN